MSDQQRFNAAGYWLLIWTLLLSNSSNAAYCETNSYATMDEAASAAGQLYYQISAQEDREYMGGILKQNSSFSFTVSTGKRHQDEVSARIRVPRGSKLVGLWHTHGAHRKSRIYFSDVDTQLVENLGVPFYLTDARGNLRVFDSSEPTLTRAQSRRLGLGAHRGYARGRDVPGVIVKCQSKYDPDADTDDTDEVTQQVREELEGACL